VALGTVNGCVVNLIPVNGRLEEAEEQVHGRPFPVRIQRPLPDGPMPKRLKPEQVLREAFEVEAEPIPEDEFALLNMLFGRVR